MDDIELSISSVATLIVKSGAYDAEEGDNLIVIPEVEGAINVAWFMYEFIALAIPMKHVHAPGKCNKEMSGKLSQHLRTTADDDDEMFSGTDMSDDDREAPIDPRWNELKKILDNN